MMQFAALPRELDAAIGDEKKEFAVKAGRAQPLKSSLFMIAFGTFWTAFTGIFVVAFLGPLFVGKEVEFSSGGVPTVAGPDNLEPVLVPALIIGFFVLIGLILLGVGISSAFKKGGYFVGTPLRLIQYRKGTVRSIDWELFSGHSEVKGNAYKGNISCRCAPVKWPGQQKRTGPLCPRHDPPAADRGCL
ncbi:MAG: hypothetical protein R2751_09765 [Bacteroidales bacterium]